MERVKMMCQNCGKEFEVFPYEVRNGRKFCSKRCMDLYKRKRVKRCCRSCGKEFEVKRSLVEKNCGNFCCRECYIKYRRSEEQRKQTSERMKALCRDPEYRKKVSERMKAFWQKLEYRKKISEKVKAVWQSDEYKKKVSEKMKVACQAPEHRKRVSERIKALWQLFDYRERMLTMFRSYERRKRLSEKIKAKYLDLQYKEMVVKRTMEACNVKPNGLEKAVCELLQSYFVNEWKYTGDGRMFIGGFIPDFVHREEKWIIEVNGDYWHRLSEAVERDKKKREIYNKYGYKVLEVWEGEIKENPMGVVSKIVDCFYEVM